MGRTRGDRPELDRLVEEITVDAYGEDEELWAFRQAFEDEIALPADAFVIGEPVSLTDIDYGGNPRRGLMARFRREDGTEHVIAVSDVVFPEPSDGARYVAAYRTWLGLEPTQASPPARRKRRHRAAAANLDRSGDVELVLDRLTPEERTSILKSLLHRHPELQTDVEGMAVEILSTPSAGEVSEAVCSTLRSLGLDAIGGRAGRHSWGYVEPTEATWEVLHEAVEDIVADMKRRMELGLTGPAEILWRGFITGLRTAANHESDGLLSWAPDFPLEEACHATSELLRACPKGDRAEVCDRLLSAVGEDVPEWSDALGRAVLRAIRKK